MHRRDRERKYGEMRKGKEQMIGRGSKEKDGNQSKGKKGVEMNWNEDGEGNEGAVREAKKEKREKSM